MKRSARTTRDGFGLLAMLLMLAAALTLPGHAMADSGVRCAPTGIEGVATDRYSYQGGETAFITGSGYAPGCDVLVRITRPDGVVETAPATTDLSGAFSHQYVLPGPPNLSGEFLLEVVGFGETVLASTEFADALAIDTYITRTYVAGSQAVTFRTLVRNTSNDTPIRQINIALPGPPTAYAAKSVANSIFSSGAGTFAMAATPASGFDFTFTATTGNSLALSTGWARFEITATTPALSTGSDARWEFQACGNVGCGGAGSTRAEDRPVVLVNPIPPANRYTADFRTAADVVTAPGLTNGVAATLRLRITSAAGANNSSRHLTIALPRCFSSPTAVTVTGGSGYDPPAVRDGFIILSGGSVGSVGSFLTVQFTSTPSGCATGAQAFESAVGSTPQDPANNTDHVVARAGNDPVVTFNSPPVANNDAYSVNEDNALMKNAGDGVLANDTDADGHTLTAELVTGPANGTLTLNANGSFTYTPNADFFGADSFTYRANDGFQTSNTTTVGITVKAVNDAPSFTKGTDVTVAEDSGAYTEAVWATDISAGPANESGQTVTFLVTGNTNAALFSAGPAVTSNGTVTFTPAANAFGTATITLKANDNGGTANGGVAESAAQIFSITVTAVDDVPTAVDDAATVSEDSGASGVDVLANDTDIDGGRKSVASVTHGAEGSVAITGDGSGVSYTPNGDYCGPDSFTYTLNGGSTGTVTVDVECVNDRPVGVDDAASGTEDTDVIIDPADLLENDTDVDAGDTLSVTAVGSASGGAVELDEGEIVFSPAGNLCGEGVASFEYTVSDGELTDIATVTISLACVNDAPVVTADSASVTVDEGDTALNSGTWTDVEGDAVTLIASVGTVTKHEDGTWSWSYATSDGPADSATVMITADDGEDTGSVTFGLTVENVAPDVTAAGDQASAEGVSTEFELGSFTDPGADSPWQVSVDFGDGSDADEFQATSAGALAARSHSYDDDGTYTVTVTVTDKDDDSDSASFEVEVANTAPQADFQHNGPVDEGSPIELELANASDPSSADTAAGFEFRFSCDNGATWTAWGASNTASCSTSDNGTRHIKGEIRDKDGGTSSYSASVTVENVAPSATFDAPESAFEGSDINLSLSDVVDPGTADTHEFRFSCDGGGTWTAWITSASHACATDDNGTVEVRGQVRDDDGGTSADYSDSVTVNNVAPSAKFNNNGPVDEGSNIDLSLTDVVDPGSADTHEFRFSCDGGTTWTDWSSTASHTCSTNDNGTRSVRGQVRDDDRGLSEEYSASVTIDNIVPTATFNAPETVEEGSAISISLTNASDPSSVDTAAGFEYRFSCDNGDTWSDWGASNEHSCPTSDNGTKNVKSQIRDKDDGTSTYSASVTVTNVVPSATFNAPEFVNEGSDINLSLSEVVDPGSADTHEYRFSCDGGGMWTAWGNSTHACETTDDGSVDVRGQVRDDDGAASEVYSDEVTVNNVAPTATFTDNGPVDEGSNANLALSDVVDPGAADTHEFRFSCNDGTTWTDWGSSATHSCSTNDDGTRNVKGQVRDDDGGTSEEYGSSVTVDNVAPVATITAPETVDEGSNISVSLTDPSDPSSVDTAAGFQFRFSCDGGATWTSWSTDNTYACSTDDNGTENVEGEIRDKDGGTSTYSDSVTVKNVAPTATFYAPTSVTEGSPIAISLTSPSDPSSVDTSSGFHYAFDCGDGSGYGGYSSTDTRSCPTSDNGTRTVGGRIKDKDGGVTEYTASVTVNNGPPTLTSLTPSSYLVLKGTAATVTGAYTDPGTSETFTCVVNWDEPTATPENTAGGANSCSASHTYTVQGTYTISMKVRDDDGGESNTMTVIITVYDPEAGGFVTGGGWITSPKGSYAGDPEASGRANFGFTSQYKRGASIPTGETEFQLHFATFNFHSEAYEVLVVSGYKAQYRGTGKVNGVTGYKFVLTAYDGQITGGGGTDRFRIKITRIVDGVVVYDTKMGVSEDMDLADPLALGGGSIVIHKAK